MKNLVFVYGTLKREFYNHCVMEQSGGTYLGEASLSNMFTMISCGPYPALVKGGEGTIHGEVYDVTDMIPLDRLEGYPHHYNRELVETPYGEAWVYYYNETLEHVNERGARIVESGKWGE